MVNMGDDAYVPDLIFVGNDLENVSWALETGQRFLPLTRLLVKIASDRWVLYYIFPRNTRMIFMSLNVGWKAPRDALISESSRLIPDLARVGDELGA